MAPPRPRGTSPRAAPDAPRAPVVRRRPDARPTEIERADAPRAEAPRTGERRALSHVGGEVALRGDRRAGEILRHALDVPDDPEAARAHIHGFHSYPARMHPVVARRAIEGLAPRGARVLDPFAGSGTVLVEARLAGAIATGVDLNPLAVRLASLKVEGRAAAERDALLAAAAGVAAVANERRKRKSGASRRYPPEDVAFFDAHVLLELDGLRVGIEGVESPRIRGDLGLVLSSLLTKLSRRRGDAADGAVTKRLAAGYPTRMFLSRTRELVLQLTELEAALPHDARLGRVILGDARVLAPVHDASIDLVVTSPPYPGNYDYLSHHAMRLRWLGLRADELDTGELGARRHLEADPAAAEARWREDLAGVMKALLRVLRPGGQAMILIADSVVAKRPLYNDDLTTQVAERAGLDVVAIASQLRPHFHLPSRAAFRARPREEHAILLARGR